MEDEKGLDLSLGLPCGGNSSTQKSKYGVPSHIGSDENDRGSKLINEFRNFLEGGNQQHSVNVGEKFYNNLEPSNNSNTGGLWLRNDGRSTEIEEDKISSIGEKRKNLFLETNQEKKKLDRDASHGYLTDKAKAPHISITTDEGSTADNEDVAESEVDGSTSRFVSSGGLEKKFNVTNMPLGYAVPFRGQPVNINASSSQPMKDSSASGVPGGSSYPLPSKIHDMAATNGDRPATFPLMFGYSPVQLPSLDRDSSQGIIPHHQEAHPTYSGRSLLNHDAQNDRGKLTQGILHKSPESTPYSERALEHGNSHGKQQVGEEGSTSHTEGDAKGYNPAKKDAPDQPRPAPAAEPIPSELLAIRPGIAAELKFGGCGSYPNLPWVSTTSQGPNGRTISGVTYRYSTTQIRIVCACHGSHMSPEEFVRHASAEESSHAPDALASFPSSNPSASAQS